MQTFGIDLATHDGTCGLCLIDWGSDRARVMNVEVGRFTNDVLVDKTRHVLDEGGWAGIDAPFGFPARFSQAVQLWDSAGAVLDDEGEAPLWLHPAGRKRWNATTRRLTDGYVAWRQYEDHQAGARHTNWPLSAVVERITPTVLRCARLLWELSEGHIIDRIGYDSRIIETYPAAALRLWKFSTDGYKDKKQDASRVAIVEKLESEVPWLDLGVHRAEFVAHDDALDALICAMTARLAGLPGRATDPVTAGVDLDMNRVRREGWIHLPLEAQMDTLL